MQSMVALLLVPPEGTTTAVQAASAPELTPAMTASAELVVSRSRRTLPRSRCMFPPMQDPTQSYYKFFMIPAIGEAPLNQWDCEQKRGAGGAPSSLGRRRCFTERSRRGGRG